MNKTPEEIARIVLTSFSGPFYVAGNPTQRDRIVQEAAKAIAPFLTEKPEVTFPAT